MKRNCVTLLMILSIMMVFPISAWSVELKICTDENFWYPFSYVEKGIAKGLHVDMVAEACRQLNWGCDFTPLPWRRCLELNAKNGVSDAVVSASYKPSRAKYLYYPEGAETAKKSKWRITQAEYVVVTHISNPYQFDGDVKTIPFPVRAEFAYSIVDDLKKKGVEIMTYKSSKKMFRSLIRTKRGALVTIPNNVGFLANELDVADQVKIHSKKVKSKSYYIVFSKQSKLNSSQFNQMWQKIREIRNNRKLFQKISAQY